MFIYGDTYSIEEIFRFPIRKDGKKINKEGFSDDGFACKISLGEDSEGNNIQVNLSSQRIQLFRHKGLSCKCCGLKGQYFKAQRSSKDTTYHLNLYGVNQDGLEVLFTKDHIIPKSLGGSNSLRNYATMCETCNYFKSNDILTINDLRDKIIATFQKDARYDSLDKNACLDRVLELKSKDIPSKEVIVVHRMEDIQWQDSRLMTTLL